MTVLPTVRLGVNIDHIATLRQARGTRYPEVLHAAMIAEQAGADGITIHLREDRRHIQLRDVELLKQTLQTPMNLEMAITPEMLAIAVEIKPTYVCLVPEKREELTTEGGLDVLSHMSQTRDAVLQLEEAGIKTSLFIDADKHQIEAAVEVGAPLIELHTGTYADLPIGSAREQELAKICDMATYAQSGGLQVNAGHGLHYHNVEDIVAIPEIIELNIGHSIISRAVFTGLEAAVRDMKALMCR